MASLCFSFLFRVKGGNNKWAGGFKIREGKMQAAICRNLYDVKRFIQIE